MNEHTRGMIRRHAGAAVTDRLALVPEAESSRVSAVLGRAFAEEPFIDWLLRADRKRPQALRSFFDYVLSVEAFPNRNIIQNADGTAFAIWLPYGEYGAEAEIVRPLRRLQFVLGICSLRRSHRFFKLVKLSKDKMPRREHCYLQFLCVDPLHQNNGIGRRLMELSLDYFDSVGMPTYLEAGNPRNIAFYERLGYAVTGAYRYSKTHPDVALMWRDPRVSGDYRSSTAPVETFGRDAARSIA
jgi:ribosomal protein S18 acetylase RimI-like enzyme